MATTNIAVLTPNNVPLSSNPINAVRQIAQLLMSFLSGTGSNTPTVGQIQAEQSGTGTLTVGALFVAAECATTDTGDYNITSGLGADILLGTAPFASQAAAATALETGFTTFAGYSDSLRVVNKCSVLALSSQVFSLAPGDSITVDGVEFVANNNGASQTSDTGFDLSDTGNAGDYGFQAVFSRHPTFKDKVGCCLGVVSGAASLTGYIQLVTFVSLDDSTIPATASATYAGASYLYDTEVNGGSAPGALGLLGYGVKSVVTVDHQEGEYNGTPLALESSNGTDKGNVAPSDRMEGGTQNSSITVTFGS